MNETHTILTWTNNPNRCTESQTKYMMMMNLNQKKKKKKIGC